MATCDHCGGSMAEEDRFCQSCGAYTAWGDHTRSGATPSTDATTPTRTGPAGGAGRSAPGVERADARHGVALAVPPPVDVAPESTTTVEVRVRNVGTLVDEYVVEVAGAPRSWVRVEPPQVSVYPGTEGTVTLTFRPPRDPSVRAGRTSYDLTARSVLHAEAVATQPGVVDVGRIDDADLGLVPHEARDRRTTVHRLTLVNDGNADVRAELSGSDPQGELELRFAPPVLVAAPGTQTTATVQARARQWRWRGGDRARPFTVQARADGGRELTAQGVSVQRPLPTLLIVLLATLLAGMTAVVAVPQVRELVAGAWSSIVDGDADDDGTGGGSDGGGDDGGDGDGAGDDGGDGDGSGGDGGDGDGGGGGGGGDGGQVVRVPDVVGLTEQQAIAALQQRGLGTSVQRQPASAPPGTVVVTSPRGDQAVRPGTTVTVVIATRPPDGPGDLVLP